MSAENPSSLDRAAIEEHAQRTVEQAALRKVRRTLDRIEQEESAERRTLRKLLLVCALLLVLGGWLIWEIVVSDRGMPKPPPLQVPQKLQQTR